MGVPRLLGSTATGGSVQAALWNAVCKHVWKVGIVSMRGVKCTEVVLVSLTDYSHKHIAIALQPPAGWKPASLQGSSLDAAPTVCWAEALLKIARMTLTIKRDGNWSSFQLANSALPLSVTSSAIAPSARMHNRGPQKGQQSKGWWHKGLV